MTGRIGEVSIYKLKEKKLSDQSQLDRFSGSEATYAGVVRSPQPAHERFLDEIWYELGMPAQALQNFLERRSGYRSNSAIDNPHNRAYEDENLSTIYQSYIEQSYEANKRLDETVERLLSGENITLVCYEQDGEKCHRDILVDILEERVEERKSDKFTFVY